MAFDVYVGTFTRFYRRDWENAVQRQARIDGASYKMIYAGGEPLPPPPAEEVQQAVAAWQNAISQGLAANGGNPVTWSESLDKPYFTDRPGWPGYSGLLLWAAYAEDGAKPPHTLPEVWAEDPVFLRVMQNEANLHFRVILQANLWLPGDFYFCFKFPDLTGKETMIASCAGLLEQLRELNAKPLAWSSPSLVQRFKPRDSFVPFEEAAMVGMRVFTELAQHAVSNNLPIMLSF
ncbi:MAG TPA: hypothetical protein VK138_14185 [Acidiferrobacterales bacterium]|nr:hypothetical protein [Acidiferrobacterales bacterium]